MRALNRRYRGKDSPTDVLAFPAANFPGASVFPGQSEEFLGDIAISVPYASRQARRAAEPLAGEVDRLLLHGFLHLLGYDHDTDRGEMDLLETKLRRRLNLLPRDGGESGGAHTSSARRSPRRRNRKGVRS